MPIHATVRSSFGRNVFTSVKRHSPTNRPRTTPKAPPTGLNPDTEVRGLALNPRPPTGPISPITRAMMKKIRACSISRTWMGPYSSRPSFA